MTESRTVLSLVPFPKGKGDKGDISEAARGTKGTQIGRKGDIKGTEKKDV